MNTSLATPQGPGSVCGAPYLPAGFAGTFTSRYVDTGDLRLHAVTGGGGPPLLLVHGWPQTWYAWRMLMPALARDFSVVAVDQRGIGLSDKPQDGYDTATLASDLVALMDALGHRRFALYGTDTGMPVAYALAADHPGRADRLSQAAVRQVRAFTGYDRVVAYRFDGDGPGEVIAEDVAPGWEPWLGLWFPAIDVPPQARRLYLQNWIRVIADVNDRGAMLIPPQRPGTQRPLDLSGSALRTVSSYHLEYLRNIGVRGSMSLSLGQQRAQGHPFDDAGRRYDDE